MTTNPYRHPTQYPTSIEEAWDCGYAHQRMYARWIDGRPEVDVDTLYLAYKEGWWARVNDECRAVREAV